MFDILISSCRCQQVTGRIILSFVPPQDGLKPKLDSIVGRLGGREREGERKREEGGQVCLTPLEETCILRLTI